ncbi:hypothetical protein AURDEDRAFT_175522 [Auricularia subglabra TFB-10046 SS5]|uniref:Uncharacterized protein n=1 Tax=Auricularia subglabra (strain TFB-10046 / SS5) TaxID=717982 RepID=J0LEU0_AURST|nr:hypothetical protein AURDEDRAFT_175522 [Auricularia subglabra TFB-10046 SS5]
MGFNTPVSLPRTDSDARGALRVLEYQVSDVTCVQEPPHAMHSVLIAPRGDSRLVPHSLVLSSRVSNVRIDAANADISQLVGAQRSMNNAHNSAVPMPSLIQIACSGSRSAWCSLNPSLCLQPAAAPSSSQKQHNKLLGHLRIALECDTVALDHEHQEKLELLATDQKADSARH